MKDLSKSKKDLLKNAYCAEGLLFIDFKIIKPSTPQVYHLVTSVLHHAGNCFPNLLSILKVMAFTSLGVVLVSTLTFVLGTFPEFQSFEESGTPEEYPEAVAAMSMIDNVLVGFFVIEYVVSFLQPIFRSPTNLLICKLA